MEAKMSEQPTPQNPPPKREPIVAVHRRSNDPVEDAKRAREASHKFLRQVATMHGVNSPSPESGKEKA